MLTEMIFRIAEVAYKQAFPLYKVSYELYKRLSDRAEIGLLKELVKPGFAVADVGANIGFYSRLLSGLVGPEGEVHSFEPSPENFMHLRESTKSLGNVSINNKAVSATSGKLNLFLSNKYNVDHRAYPNEGSTTQKEVECVRLDDYFGDKRVDFVKVDIQGFEYQALLGMENIIKSNQEIKLVLEFWPFGLRAAGNKPENVIAFLRDLDFSVYLLEGKELSKISEKAIVYNEAVYYNIYATR